MTRARPSAFRARLDQTRRARLERRAGAGSPTTEPVAGEESDERFRERFVQAWSETRTRRAQGEDPQIAAGPSNLDRAQVPWAYDLAAAWAWRFVVISAAGLIVLYLMRLFAVVVLPLAIALLIAALASPLLHWLIRRGVPRRLGGVVIVLLGLGLVALMLTFIGQQVGQAVGDLSQGVVDGLGTIRDWVQTGPLRASDSQINDVITSVQGMVRDQGTNLAGRLTEVTTAVGHLVAGLFIVLFATYFFLADGPLIWAWVVRLFPRAARLRADTSGRVAWRSLTQFVRATVLVASTDALGVMAVALVLGLPFIGAIGALVLIGAFVPLVGALVSGSVAVLVALVDQGPVAALLMLAGVIAVQQLEAHVLQPFLMGRFVSVHPLGVIVTVAAGILVAGIPGALLSVPLVAAANAIAQHLASYTEPGSDPLDAAVLDPVADPLLADDAADRSAERGER